MTAEFIVVHNTANDATAENEVAYMIRIKIKSPFIMPSMIKEVVKEFPLLE